MNSDRGIFIKEGKTWGLPWADFSRGDYIYRYDFLRSPYKADNTWTVGVGKKFLMECLAEGVHKIVLVVGEREFIINPLPEKFIKLMEKEGRYEDKPSMFKDAEPMRLLKIQLSV